MAILICVIFFCIRITKNYIIDTTNASKGSQASLFSDDLKYLNDCQNKSTEMITPKGIGIIKAFEEKVSLILLHTFISIERIT